MCIKIQFCNPCFYLKWVLIFMFQFWCTRPLFSQDLDPRAYARVPVNLTTLITGFSYSYGAVVTQPTLPFKDIKAKVETPMVGVAHSFALLKRTAQVMVALPYSWAQVSGQVGNQVKSITRSGFSDMRLRFSWLLIGAPVVSMAEFANAPKKSVVGVSVTVIAPTGQFFSDKLINLGTNRFSFKPEVALSQPLLKHLLLDVYAGVWLFTANHSFYPGNAVRTQQPMGTFQTHLSYNIRPMMWVALDGTYYTGGQSSVNHIYNDDRQSNSRVGVTAVLPLGKLSALKLSFSTGAVVRLGQDFSSFSIGWQSSWMNKSSKKKAPNSE